MVPQGITAVILAGGRGTRLGGAFPNLPKAMAPIGSQPFLELQVKLLRSQGWNDFVLCVGYQHEQIQEYVGNGNRWGIKVRYTVERDRLMGTGGAVRNALELVGQRCLILNGDTYFPIAYADLVSHHMEAHKNSAVVGTIGLARPQDRASYGSVELDSTESFVRNYRVISNGSAPSGEVRWASAGVYVFETEIMNFIPKGQKISLEKEVTPGVLEAGEKLAAFRSESRYYDIGTPKSWQEFVKSYAEQKHAE